MPELQAHPSAAALKWWRRLRPPFRLTMEAW